MNIAPFKLERYFAKYEFNAEFLLCSSDCEAMSIADLLADCLSAASAQSTPGVSSFGSIATAKHCLLNVKTTLHSACARLSMEGLSCLHAASARVSASPAVGLLIANP